MTYLRIFLNSSLCACKAFAITDLRYWSQRTRQYRKATILDPKSPQPTMAQPKSNQIKKPARHNPSHQHPHQPPSPNEPSASKTQTPLLLSPSQSTWALTSPSHPSTCPLTMAHTPVTHGSPPQPPLQSQPASSPCAVSRRASADLYPWADRQSDETLPCRRRLPLPASSNSVSGSLAWRSPSQGQCR